MKDKGKLQIVYQEKNTTFIPTFEDSNIAQCWTKEDEEPSNKKTEAYIELFTKDKTDPQKG